MMKNPMPHSWDVSPKEAIAIQERMSQHVMRTDQLDEVHWVAGIDVGFEAQGTITHAAVAVLSFPAMELEEQATARRPTTFPYVPGLLSFREVPVILDALEKLKRQPDLLLCDGQGLAHPRRFGLACHLGLLVDLPSIGVGKSRLVGQSEPVGAKRAERQPLIDGDEVIGFVLRTRTDVKPLFISIGHRVSLETAVEYVLQCGGKYRLPEPIRQAHRLASSA